mgnify:CR=1 FL=1
MDAPLPVPHGEEQLRVAKHGGSARACGTTRARSQAERYPRVIVGVISEVTSLVELGRRSPVRLLPRTPATLAEPVAAMH